MEEKLTTGFVEKEIAGFFNPLRSLIVPRVMVSKNEIPCEWGNHECDLIIVQPSDYAYEIEIKVDKYDLKKDCYKTHHHECAKIRRLYFAIPWYLMPEISEIPDEAGIFIITKSYLPRRHEYCHIGRGRVVKIRDGRNKSDYKLSLEDKFRLCRLGTMKLWL
jgi:hypothetical protein